MGFQKMTGDQLSSELCKSVIVPYLKNLIKRQGKSAELQIDYYDSHVPIIHTENLNFCEFSIVMGRVLIRHNGVKLIDDTHGILRRLDFGTDESAMRTLLQLVDRFLMLSGSSGVDAGEAWFTNYTSRSNVISSNTAVTPAKI